MRRLPVVVFAAVLGSAPAYAADIAARSTISGVTVFPTGAEVVRLAKVKVPAGEHAVVVDELPPAAIPGSVRVEGMSTGNLVIGSVDTRRILVPHADPAQQASERRRLETEIEKLRDDRAGIEADVKAADIQKSLITKLTELPTVSPQPGSPAAGQIDWNQIFGLVGARFAEAERAQLAATAKIRAIDRQIADLEKKLASLAPGQQQRTEVKVFVQSGGEVDLELRILYQVGQAQWIPHYDARLVTGSKTAAPKLTLVRRATIQQRTGEDWADVALQLSTTRPGTGTAAPVLEPTTVDFEPDAPPPRPMAMPAPTTMSRSLRGRQATAEMADAAAEPAMKAAEMQQSTIEAGAFQATFKVPAKLSVPGNGEQKRVELETTAIDPSLVVRTTPRIEARAYLYAKLATPRTGAPYLPGQVALFRDGTFVGNGRLPQLTPGEDHELGFGADDAVRVRHAVVDEKRGESGIISSSRTDARNYRITVKNAHSRPIQLTVLDQVPVSQNQDIKVELTTRSQPTRRDVDDKRGVMAWDQTLAPDEERTIEFGYRVVWPAAKRIQYGR